MGVPRTASSPRKATRFGVCTMRTHRYPTRQAELVDWSRTHATLWKGGQTGVPDIVVSQTMADNFDLAVSDVEAKLAAQGAALSAARAATEDKDAALDEMLRQLGSIMTTIDGYGRNTDDPGVWVRAQIPAPRTGGERPAPPMPTARATELIDNGSVVFGWEVASGGGAMYEVQRQVLPIGGQPGPWTTIAFLGEKRFVDEAVPVGVAAVNYQVRVRIPSAASPWSLTSTANFGSAGSQGGPLARVA